MYCVRANKGGMKPRHRFPVDDLDRLAQLIHSFIHSYRSSFELACRAGPIASRPFNRIHRSTRSIIDKSSWMGSPAAANAGQKARID